MQANILQDWLYQDDAYIWTSVIADYNDNSLFLVDSFHRVIVEMSMVNKPNPKILYNALSSNIGKIAYDWQTSNIYWTDTLFYKIMMASVHATADNSYETVIHLTPDQPFGLALYPPDG